MLYHNHTADITGQIIHEDDFPELGLILLIEQEGEYVDYESKLNKMERFKPVLLYRSEYPDGVENYDVLFDLAEDRSKQMR